MNGKPQKNEEQPAKFFNEAEHLLNVLSAIPLSAIDKLKKSAKSQGTVNRIIEACFHILDIAGIEYSPTYAIEEAPKEEKKQCFSDGVGHELTLDDLKKSGRRLEFTKDGPIIVDVDGG